MMCMDMYQHFGEPHRNVRTLIVGEHQPVLVRSFVEAAEDFAPGEFALTGEFGIDDAFVERVALGVVRDNLFIKRMGVSEQQQLNALVCVGQYLDIKRAKIRVVDSKPIS